jgi:membrane protein DedA with SNARE-associated domain
MKNTLLNSAIFLTASICYFIATVLTIQEGEASGYRFYLQLLSGVLFFIVACATFIKSRSEKKSGEVK